MKTTLRHMDTAPMDDLIIIVCWIEGGFHLCRSAFWWSPTNDHQRAMGAEAQWQYLDDNNRVSVIHNPTGWMYTPVPHTDY